MSFQLSSSIQAIQDAGRDAKQKALNEALSALHAEAMCVPDDKEGMEEEKAQWMERWGAQTVSAIVSYELSSPDLYRPASRMR
jgi:hypothetical protein